MKILKLAATLALNHISTKLQDGSCLKQDTVTFTH